jgi:hypothetical protein
MIAVTAFRSYRSTMQAMPLLMTSIVALVSASASAAPLPVVMKDGAAHVNGAALEREAGIVVKRLSNRGGFVACGAEACAPLKSVVAEGRDVLVPVAELTEVMNLTASFDEGKRHVIFAVAASRSTGRPGAARVGSIAPNLRLTKLDGSPVSIDEFRGQRVLINSWASW